MGGHRLLVNEVSTMPTLRVTIWLHLHLKVLHRQHHNQCCFHDVLPQSWCTGPTDLLPPSIPAGNLKSTHLCVPDCSDLGPLVQFSTAWPSQLEHSQNVNCFSDSILDHLNILTHWQQHICAPHGPDPFQLQIYTNYIMPVALEYLSSCVLSSHPICMLSLTHTLHFAQPHLSSCSTCLLAHCLLHHYQPNHTCLRLVFYWLVKPLYHIFPTWSLPISTWRFSPSVMVCTNAMVF
jgi:hypothetical protein